MEENEKGKEIALTGKYAVIRALKKVLKDPIAGEVVKDLCREYMVQQEED